jgi:hypothetical protein
MIIEFENNNWPGHSFGTNIFLRQSSLNSQGGEDASRPTIKAADEASESARCISNKIMIGGCGGGTGDEHQLAGLFALNY